MNPESFSAADLGSAPSHIRLLLVDDSRDFLRSASQFLSLDPQLSIVGCASSGREAVEQVSRLRPDLVLMDLNMPEMNGLAATRRIKEQPGGPLVIILTVHDHPEYRAAAEAAGACGFVTKSDFGARLVPLIYSLISGAGIP